MNTKRDKNNFIQPAHTIVGNYNYIPLNPYYISGFFIGDGCFSLKINKNNNKSTVFGSIIFCLTQNKDSTYLLRSILDYLNLNGINLNISRNTMQINISSREILKNVIIPFFNKYHLHGIKAIDFEKIKDILNIIEENTVNIKVKWTPKLKEKILFIWNNNTSVLNENATLKTKGWI
jgi:LAGLIDADG endonuclease